MILEPWEFLVSCCHSELSSENSTPSDHNAPDNTTLSLSFWDYILDLHILLVCQQQGVYFDDVL